jgi:cytochrome oxidase Cu insertion factor (SCO1/SenC/PrrC family)
VKLALLLLAVAAATGAEEAAPERLRNVDSSTLSATYAVGGFVPEYTPPPPGTYELPVIDTVGDHPLLDADGHATRLFALTGERIALVAFVYTACVEAVGCPVSNAVLHQVDRAVAADGALASAVTLLTVSFDPERDTPERMARQRDLHAPRSTWRFATASNEAEIQPLLEDFGQPVAKLRFEDGTWTGLFRHVLKVFLLDRQHRVRGIYSTGFLNPALVLNDMKTLSMERGVAAALDGR